MSSLYIIHLSMETRPGTRARWSFDNLVDLTITIESRTSASAGEHQV